MRRAWRLLAAAALCGAITVPLTASAQGGDYQVSNYATGLNGPRGLTWDANGNLVVAEAGPAGGTGSIVSLRDTNGNGMIDNESEMKALINGIPSLTDETPEGVLTTGISGVAMSADGQWYFVQGGGIDPNSDQLGSLWSTAAAAGSNPLRVANPYAKLSLYEAANNPDGTEVDSNPYGVVVDAEGNAYVTDAGANDVLMVKPDGTISTYAVFPPVEVDPSLGLPFPVTDFVPTGITWGPDGALYVGGLTGFPFGEGKAMVYRLEDANSDGNAMGAGEMTVYADGLTTVTGIAFDNDGNLVVSEFYSGLPMTAPDEPGKVVKVMPNGTQEVIADGLITPTGITVGPDNTVYVSEEFAGQIVAIRESTPDMGGQ